MPTVKQISIKSATSVTGYDTREIGAEALNVEVQYDASGNIITDLNTQTPDPSKTESLAEVLDNKAPKNHADTTTKYGAASQTEYGHVKIGAGLDVTNGEVSIKYGTTAGTAVEGDDARLSDDRKNPNALSFADGTRYDGSVAESIDADSVGAAVKNHASATDEFGAGTQIMFGHVKVSDVYKKDLGTASTSLAASQHAIYEVYQEAIRGSGSAGRELTKAEYDALTEDEKTNGTIYFITDAEGGGQIIKNKINYSGGEDASKADLVSYDNMLSELAATNVQSAIDEIDSSLDTLSTTISVLDTSIKNRANSMTYDEDNNLLYLRADDKVLSTVHIEGGGATITPKPTVNPRIKNDDKKVVITWEDPTDTVIEGSTFSKWAGTKLVMKESGYPTSPDDGTVLVDNTTRDKYKTAGFEKSGLTNDTVYYFALFPYSTDGVYNYDSGNRLLGEPTEGLKIVTFADGTDEEIAKMIQAHYNDKINIADYWAVGDTRSVSLSAMSATGVGESHRAQTVQFVIGDFNHDDLTTPINGHTKAAVTLLQKDCLMDASNASNPVNGRVNTENGYMNSTNTNAGGWKNCARRTWCNSVYFNSLPNAWQSIVKTVNKKVSVGNNSSTIETVQDKIFLAAEIEIFDSTTYSFAGEGTQYQYYKNATANRYKMPKWDSSSVSSIYWGRSPSKGYSTGFCVVYISGGEGVSDAAAAYGVAPCLCI